MCDSAAVGRELFNLTPIKSNRPGVVIDRMQKPFLRVSKESLPVTRQNRCGLPRRNSGVLHGEADSVWMFAGPHDECPIPISQTLIDFKNCFYRSQSVRSHAFSSVRISDLLPSSRIACILSTGTPGVGRSIQGQPPSSLRAQRAPSIFDRYPRRLALQFRRAGGMLRGSAPGSLFQVFRRRGPRR